MKVAERGMKNSDEEFWVKLLPSILSVNATEVCSIEILNNS